MVDQASARDVPASEIVRVVVEQEKENNAFILLFSAMVGALIAPRHFRYGSWRRK
jgi:hypothetical protein